jgi:MFS family permease
MTSSLVASAASAKLERVHGMAGWRWLYIICFAITIPVGILGYFLIPGTLAKPNRIFLNEEELDVARKRLERDGHKVGANLKFHHIKHTVKTSRFCTVVLIDILWKSAGAYKTQGAYLL